TGPWLPFRIKGEGACLIQSVVPYKMAVAVVRDQKPIGLQGLEPLSVGSIGFCQGRLKRLQALLKKSALGGQEFAEQSCYLARRGERQLGAQPNLRIKIS